jgi:hypothetical protein
MPQCTRPGAGVPKGARRGLCDRTQLLLCDYSIQTSIFEVALVLLLVNPPLRHAGCDDKPRDEQQQKRERRHTPLMS